MVRLGKSAISGKITRKDDLEQQSITTWTLLRQAIKDKKHDEGLELLQFLHRESWLDQVDFISRSLAYIAKNHGEDEVARAITWWRKVQQEAGDPVYSLSLEELIQYQMEQMRASLTPAGKDCFTIKEEADRIVISVDPAHVLRLVKPSAITRQPHPWSWGRAGIPYYCAQCCLWWEIMPIEHRGYPLRVHERPQDMQEPCRIIYYKKPELVPDRYYRTVGLAKKLPKLG
ncbi:MAG: hypothetical protein Q7R57_03750 [Dehalococcoidales bacterium]|nr:hypothetical protein [Dehalococcoidales bacterium]